MTSSPTLLAPVVVMGVAGCGKTTIGQLLAEHLEVPYIEADDFHPHCNIKKMTAGIALTDDDRQPWLAALANKIRQNTSVVASCSALKRRYRDTLRCANSNIWFLHLSLDQTVATQRVARRPGHFMPASLIPSQFEVLEPLEAERGLTVDATQPPVEIVQTAISALSYTSTN